MEVDLKRILMRIEKRILKEIKREQYERTAMFFKHF